MIKHIKKRLLTPLVIIVLAVAVFLLPVADKDLAVNAASGKVKSLTPYISEDRACSSCYAALVYALMRLSRRELDSLGGPVAIGQGFVNKKGRLGIGKCTSAFAKSCPGCPPAGADILKFLKNNI